jgi:predicted dehydrogenase
MKANSELRIGIIGAGGRGGIGRYAHKPEQGVRVVAGADVNPKAFERFKQDFGDDVFTTDDYRRVLEQDIDAVFITSPDFLHEEHAVAALQAGKHVYLEKPMAITIEGCDRILQAAFDSKVKLYLGHNMRHFPVVRKMKQLIESGAIGEPKTCWCRHFISYGGDAYYKDWHAEIAKSTGLLLQKGAHDIDVMHWLCGGYSSTVVGMGALTLYDKVPNRRKAEDAYSVSWHDTNWPPMANTGLNPIIEVEDINMMLMHLDNGVFASYQQCHYTPDAWRNYTVIGTEGRIENVGDSGEKALVHLWDKRGDSQPDAVFRFRPIKGGHGGSDTNIIAEFIRYIREGGKIDTSPVAARYSVAAGYQATMSIRDGFTPKAVPALDPELRAYFERDTRSGLTTQ